MLTVIVAAGAFVLGFCFGAGAIIRQVRSGRVVAGGRAGECVKKPPSGRRERG